MESQPVNAVDGPALRALAAATRLLGGNQLHVDAMPSDVLRLRMSTTMTRLNGMEVCAYLVGSILVDSGLVYLQPQLRAFLSNRRVDAIALTHHHEDHSGNAGAVAAGGIPVFVRNAARIWEEGMVALKPYRIAWWGRPCGYAPVEMPPTVTAGGRTLRAIPIPGHSATHTALLEDHSGVVFTGDLFVSRGATAVMSHENPFENAASLRAVASEKPKWMLTGHALAVGDPAAMLRQKAEAIENAAQQVLALHAKGMTTAGIVASVFPRGQRKERLMAWATQGEFSRANFVDACVRFSQVTTGRA